LLGSCLWEQWDPILMEKNINIAPKKSIDPKRDQSLESSSMTSIFAHKRQSTGHRGCRRYSPQRDCRAFMAG